MNHALLVAYAEAMAVDADPADLGAPEPHYHVCCTPAPTQPQAAIAADRGCIATVAADLAYQAIRDHDGCTRLALTWYACWDRGCV